MNPITRDVPSAPRRASRASSIRPSRWSRRDIETRFEISAPLSPVSLARNSALSMKPLARDSLSLLNSSLASLLVILHSVCLSPVVSASRSAEERSSAASSSLCSSSSLSARIPRTFVSSSRLPELLAISMPLLRKSKASSSSTAPRKAERLARHSTSRFLSPSSSHIARLCRRCLILSSSAPLTPSHDARAIRDLASRSRLPQLTAASMLFLKWTSASLGLDSER